MISTKIKTIPITNPEMHLFPIPFYLLLLKSAVDGEIAIKQIIPKYKLNE
jgi:hypothetical protein